MFSKVITAAATMVSAAALTFSSVPAQAGGATEQYSQIGGWKVMIDHTTGDGCFAYMQYQRGSVMRIGFDINNKGIYLMFGHPDFKDMEVGQEYRARFLFDDYYYYDGSVKTIDMSGITYFGVKVSADFMQSFAVRNNLKIINKGDVKINVSLAGTYAAIEETLRCQEQMNAQRQQEPRRNPRSNVNGPRTFSM
jgi:hypothetical protein